MLFFTLFGRGGQEGGFVPQGQRKGRHKKQLPPLSDERPRGGGFVPQEQRKDRRGFDRRTTEECAAGHGRKEGKSGDMDSFFGKTCGFCIIFRNFGRIIRDRFRRRRTKPGRSGFSGRETADGGKCKRTANRKRGTQARNEAATANGDRKTKRRLQTRKRPQTQRR